MKGLKALSPPPGNKINLRNEEEKPAVSAGQNTMPVQRQVYVGGKKLTKKQKKNLAGVKKDEIKAWDADPGKTIGFKDAAELNDFSNEKKMVLHTSRNPFFKQSLYYNIKSWC